MEENVMGMMAGAIAENMLENSDAEPDAFDNVTHPQHYCSGAHECIDVMEHLFGTQAVIDFCKCNIFKYRFRAGQKNGDEDIQKAEWYENKLMELNMKMAKR